MRPYLGVVASAILLILFAFPAQSQEPAIPDLTREITGYERAVQAPFVGVPTDWSTRYTVFSEPPAGSEIEEKVHQDARYWLQRIRRSQPNSAISSDEFLNGEPINENLASKRKRRNRVRVRKDWSESLGAAGAKVGPNFFPAKYSYSTTSASCSDYVAYNTSLAGSHSQASVIAFTNIYTGGCSGTVPTVAWSYNTGGTVFTSITPSPDGTQLAFAQSTSSGVAQLEILRPVKGQGTSAIAPVSPDTSSTTGSAYVTCKSGAGSCLLSLTFNGSANDTNSSPYYIFSGTDADTIFVADDSGLLHKFTGVFNGTPTEVINTNFPFRAAVAKLSSPIYNEVAGTVEVDASYDGTSNGSRLHEVAVDAGIVTSGNSTILGPTTAGTNCAATTAGGTAFTVDAPLVDPSAGTQGTIYVFIANDGSGTPNSSIYQFASGSVNASCGTKKINIGTGSTTSGIPVYSGAFDNLYFVSTEPSPSGNIFVCGNAGGNPTLYRVPITSNTMGVSNPGLALTNGAARCSPVTEFLNGSTDRAYLSVTANGQTMSPIKCPSPSGCLMSFTLSNPNGTTATASESGGTSGIGVDNSSSFTGASQIYFSTLTGAAAIQVSQSVL